MKQTVRPALATLLAVATRLLPAQEPAPSAVRVQAQQVQSVSQPETPGATPSAQPALLENARAALRAGQTEQAVRMAEQYTARNWRDASGYVVLGNAYMSRRTAGRFLALRAYEEAIRLAPSDPEPAYLYAQAGIFLGGDDGEAIARRGLEKVLELDPMYGMAWTQWLLGFRNSDSRRRMRERLAPHDSIPEVRARIAWLYLEDELYADADSLLDGLIARDTTNVEWLAWRAQSAFERGDTARGTEYYVRALTWAELDTMDVLWHQAIGIAHPDEIRAWTRVAPESRGQWLAAFWARRTPDLFGNTNARLVEHFQRLRYARKAYPLVHPLVSYHRSQIARALNMEPSRGEREFYTRCEMYEVVQPGGPRSLRPLSDVSSASDPFGQSGGLASSPVTPSQAYDRARISPGENGGWPESDDGTTPDAFSTLFVPLNMDLRSVDSSAARIGYNLATGLDDRGVLYLRFGQPGSLMIGGKTATVRVGGEGAGCANRDVETWTYDEIGPVRFSRPSAFSGGERTVSEMVFRSMNPPQFEGMKRGISEDAPSEPAPLAFGVWTAQFAGGRPGSTEIAVIATRGALAATLVTPNGAGEVRRGAAGWVVLETNPGAVTLLAHVRDSSKLGRQQLWVDARPYFTTPLVSDLLLAPAWSAPTPTRYDMLRHVARTLTFGEGSTLRSYAELYGLVPDGSTVRYRADYSLLRTDDVERDAARTDWPGAQRLSFDREMPLTASGITREVLDITPERLAPGRYLLRMAIRDLVAGADAGLAQISFVVR